MTSPRSSLSVLAPMAAIALVASACGVRGESPPAVGSGGMEPSAIASLTAAPTPAEPGSVVLVGRIVTMDQPAIAEAILLEGGRVAAVGRRAEVTAVAGSEAKVIELGENVAYPGFIDAHSHWIGDREYFLGAGTAADAMEAAVSRGWTSIAELWVHQPRLAELNELDRAGGLRLRVDAYLALNEPAPAGTHLGDWYLQHQPGPISDRLRVQGVKITLDNGWGSQVWWEPGELSAAIGRAHDAGWQIAIHSVSTTAHDMVLDAYEGALDGGPNELHHRIEHAIQVTDAQLERMVELGIVIVIHPDGGASDWVLEPDYLGNLGDDTSLLARWRDFADAGLHVASGVDAPWVFPDLALTDDIGRPVDQIAGGMDGHGRANPETPAWVRDQLLTPERGLTSITVDAAYALNDEANRGHIGRGTYGDITILSRDVTSGTPDEIRATRVVSTIVGGVTAYCADPRFCP